jgi:hypothetical protein
LSLKGRHRGVDRSIFPPRQAHAVSDAPRSIEAPSSAGHTLKAQAEAALGMFEWAFARRGHARPLGMEAEHLEDLELVGARGFEPPTPWPPAKCAARLRHAPTDACHEHAPRVAAPNPAREARSV